MFDLLREPGLQVGELSGGECGYVDCFLVGSWVSARRGKRAGRTEGEGY